MDGGGGREAWGRPGNIEVRRAALGLELGVRKELAWLERDLERVCVSGANVGEKANIEM